MQNTDVEQMARRLETALQKERREAVVYTWLTVLCTSAFILLACLAAAVLVAFLFEGDWLDPDAMTFYTGLNLFLAYVLATIVGGIGSGGTLRLEAAGFGATGIFLVLLFLTYATSLMERAPMLFGIGYGVAGFLVLGLLGRMEPEPQAHEQLQEPPGPYDCICGTVVAVATLIVSAYGEIFSASWLWRKPKPHEVQIAARVLCRLAEGPDHPLSSSTLDESMIRLLLRLKLIEVTQQQLRLTPKGTEFLRGVIALSGGAASVGQYRVRDSV